MNVTEQEDGVFTIEWDPDDPVEHVFNDWTEQDFIDHIMKYAQEVIDKHSEQQNDEQESIQSTDQPKDD